MERTNSPLNTDITIFNPTMQTMRERCSYHLQKLTTGVEIPKWRKKCVPCIEKERITTRKGE